MPKKAKPKEPVKRLVLDPLPEGYVPPELDPLTKRMLETVDPMDRKTWHLLDKLTHEK